MFDVSWNRRGGSASFTRTESYCISPLVGDSQPLAVSQTPNPTPSSSLLPAATLSGQSDLLAKARVALGQAGAVLTQAGRPLCFLTQEGEAMCKKIEAR